MADSIYNLWDTTTSVFAPGDNTVAGQTAAVATGNDSWGGVWDKIGAPLLNYAIQRDAAKQGLTATPANNAQALPMYQAQAATGIPPVALYLGLGLLAFVALRK